MGINDPFNTRKALGDYFGANLKVRRKVFISYHHHGDQNYYDEFSRVFHDNYEIIMDNSLERKIDSDNVEYVMRKIRDEYLRGSSCTVVLCGSGTWGRKFVDWEIKGTLDKQHGLVGVYLPASAPYPLPYRLFDNSLSGYAVMCKWNDIVSVPRRLAEHIDVAVARD